MRWRNFTTDIDAPVAGIRSPLAATVPGGVTVHHFDASNRLVRLWEPIHSRLGTPSGISR